MRRKARSEGEGHRLHELRGNGAYATLGGSDDSEM